MGATILFFFIIIPCAVQSTNAYKINASDEQALLAFKSAIEYDQNNSFITWTPNSSFCSWIGVTCSLRRQRVVSLNLSSVGLKGTISPFLGNLSFLRILDLSNNNLHGHIPSQFGSLSRLRTIHLYINQLQGSIPTTLSACFSLRILSLRQNNLIGNIPSALGFLPNLQFIQLSRNNLTGNIPKTLGNISSLNILDLRENKLEGPVPWELCMLFQLTQLNLGFNLLKGNIPSSLSNCTNLQRLGMVRNYLSGEIPWELCSKNTLLTGLFLGGNRFSGGIPITLFNCSQLEVISLSQNQMSGIVPTELGKLQRLATLMLWGNQFVSSNTTSLPNILTALTNCSLLMTVDISLNHLTGAIPSIVGQLPQTLQQLLLSFNKIGGVIPPQIGNLTNLTQLALDGNLFTGAIPSTVSKLQRMERLFLSQNNLQGNIPIEIGQLKSIGILSLDGNKLSGNIPDSLTDLQQMRQLHLNNNLLTGSIPASLGECLNLEYLDLSYNKLSGQIPPNVAGLPNLAFYFNLSNNLLEGSLPSEMVAIKVLNIQSEDAHKSFDRECNVLKRVRHRNVLKIITTYLDLNIKALIFPLMQNGSLDNILYPAGEESSQGQVCSLDLVQRLSITIDIAQGIEYLHHHCFVQVIHCDLKPSNVLLGDDMTTYLIDFSISKLCLGNSIDASSSTNTLKGSIGYIAPEYGMGDGATTKGDVYSYGIMLLEMVTGKKPTHNIYVEGMNLQKWVSRTFPNAIEEIADIYLLSAATDDDGDKVFNCLRQLISVGLLCTKEFPEERPTMIDIVKILHGVKDSFLGAASIPIFQAGQN